MLSVITGLFANDLTIAKKLLQKEQYIEAKGIYEKLAEDGNKFAQNELGNLYDDVRIFFYNLDKEKVPAELSEIVDNRKAVYWYKQSVLQNYDKGQLNLEVLCIRMAD